MDELLGDEFLCDELLGDEFLGDELLNIMDLASHCDAFTIFRYDGMDIIWWILLWWMLW